jgi:hypothetical protein
MEMTFKTVAYETGAYRIEKDPDPVIIRGEPMNWLVINIEHGTIEATVSSVPAAMQIADSFTEYLRGKIGGDIMEMVKQ